MLAMFLDMVGDIGRCWFLYVIVLQFWAVLGNVEQCWMMLAAPRYHEGSSSPLCSNIPLCNPFARSAGIFKYLAVSKRHSRVKISRDNGERT